MLALKKLFFILALCLLFIIPDSTIAAPFTGSIDSVDGFAIGAFSVWLEVEQGFVFNTDPIPRGVAVPAGWDDAPFLGDVAAEGGTWVAKIGYYDFSALIFGDPVTPLSSGTMFTFDYTGAIIGLYLAEFSNEISPGIFEEIFGTGVTVKSFDASHIEFTSVPIPANIILLGGGLLALVALRRQRS